MDILYSEKMVNRLILCLMSLTPQVSFIRAQEDGPVMVVPEGSLFKGDLKKFIQENIRCPASAVRDSVEGRITVEFKIGTTGLTGADRVT